MYIYVYMCICQAPSADFAPSADNHIIGSTFIGIISDRKMGAPSTDHIWKRDLTLTLTLTNQP